MLPIGMMWNRYGPGLKWFRFCTSVRERLWDSFLNISIKRYPFLLLLSLAPLSSLSCRSYLSLSLSPLLLYNSPAPPLLSSFNYYYLFMIFFHFCINGSAQQEESNDTSIIVANKMHGKTVTRSCTQDLTLLEARNALVKPSTSPSASSYVSTSLLIIHHCSHKRKEDKKS